MREIGSIVDCVSHLDLPVEHHIDPTMLLAKDEYLKICQTVPVNKTKNIFRYILHDTAEKTDFITKTANALHLSTVKQTKGNVTDWLSKMRDTSLVITDSFHGVVFAIIFNKPFLY